MRVVVALLLCLAALTAVAASMAMNYAFWTAQGVDLATSRVLGALSVMIDVFKATLPLVIAWAWAERFRLGTLIATVLFSGCLVFSLLSALGFAAWVRGAASESRAAATLRYRDATKELAGIDRQLAELTSARPTPVVVAAIERAKQDKRWLSSEQCKEATQYASRSFCVGFADLQVQFASALERDRFDGRAVVVRNEIDALVKSGARLDGDLQAGILSKLSGVRLGRVQKALIVLVALVIELSAGFGLFLASLPLANRARRFGGGEERRARSELARRLAIARAAASPTRLVRRADGQLMIE